MGGIRDFAIIASAHQHGWLYEFEFGGGGPEEEKSDYRQKARGGFATVTERMQDFTAGYVIVAVVIERMND